MKSINKNASANNSIDRDLAGMFEGGLSFGITCGISAQTGREVFQFNEDRLRHTLILGKTGTGKSNCMHLRECEDIRSGAGVLILAAHDEDAEYALSVVPEHRMDDVVYLDFSNQDNPPVLNPLDVDRADTAAVDRAVEDALELMRHGSYHEFTGPQFNRMGRLALRTLLDSNCKAEPCLRNAARLYEDSHFRDDALGAIKDPSIINGWLTEKRASNAGDYGECVTWFVSKLSVLENRTLRKVFGPEKRTVDLHAAMRDGKIVVIKLTSSLGCDAADVVGAAILQQIKAAIMGRQMNHREPFHIYIDEFHRFASEGFGALLSESRKFGVSFTLATQTLSQLTTFNSRTGSQNNLLERATVGNVGSVMCFRVSAEDATKVAYSFDLGDASRIKGVKRYQAAAAILQDNWAPERPMILDIPLAPEGESSMVKAFTDPSSSRAAGRPGVKEHGSGRGKCIGELFEQDWIPCLPTGPWSDVPAVLYDETLDALVNDLRSRSCSADLKTLDHIVNGSDIYPKHYVFKHEPNFKSTEAYAHLMKLTENDDHAVFRRYAIDLWFRRNRKDDYDSLVTDAFLGLP